MKENVFGAVELFDPDEEAVIVGANNSSIKLTIAVSCLHSAES